ncbi:MAG: hypothetical protein ACBR21_23235 [Microcoleus sp.]
METLKIFCKWWLILSIVTTYAIVYLAMFVFSFLSADFSSNVGLWGEFFSSPESEARDALHERKMQKNMNFIDKFFLAFYRWAKSL